MSVPLHEFRLLSADYLELLRDWRNSPRIRAQARNADMITAEMQQRWFAGLSTDKSQRYFVVMQSEHPVGVLSFTGISQHRCEWGCYLGEERVWPGSGLILEAAALDYAFGQLQVERLDAEVFADNPGPQRLHAMFGFRVAGRKTDASERELIMYTQGRFQWAARRAEVLAALPAKIQQAIAAVRFTNY